MSVVLPRLVPSALGAICSLAIIAPSVSAQPAAGRMKMPASGPIQVSVIKVDRAGGVQPLPGAMVVLERWLGDRMRAPNLDARAKGMNGIRLGEALVATSDAQGQARLDPGVVGPGQIVSVSVLHDGHTFGGDQLAGRGRPIEIRVYERTEDTSTLECDLFVGLFVDERNVVADVTLTFHNASPMIVDVDRTGLRVPMMLPALKGEPVEGVLPSGGLRNIANQRSPVRGRIRIEHGAVVYRGPILPGSNQQIRLRYAVPIEHSRQDIAIRSTLKSRQVRVLARWSKRIAPRLVPTRSFTAFERDQGEYRQRQIVLDDELPADTPLLLHLDRLPHSTSAEAMAALVGSLLLLALFGLALLAPPEALRKLRPREP